MLKDRIKTSPKKLRCKNCQLIYKGHYCPRCGQNAGVKKFDFSYFIKESFISSLDIENGFFPTIRLLTLRPGEALRAYLQGKRLSLTVPMRYLLVMGTIAAWISIRYKIFAGENAGEAPIALLNFIEKEFWEYATEFLTVLNIVTVPIFALFSYLFFRSSGYNYSENLILNVYTTAHQLFFLLVCFPFIELFPVLKSELLFVYFAITLLYNIWVYLSFFDQWYLIGLLKTAGALVTAYTVQLFVNYGIFSLLKVVNLIPHLKSIDLPG
ncbi:MAG: DUF3667 domain-containing protein [Cyclobacteriaceae bacterium]